MHTRGDPRPRQARGAGNALALQAPTGRVIVTSPDADRVAALLDGRVETRDGARVVVRHEDAAALNAGLVGEGVRVTAIRPQRRSLEQLVLETTGAGSDQVDGSADTHGTPLQANPRESER